MIDELQQGLSAHQQGDLKTATAIYQKILATAPENADAWHLLGVCYFQQGKYHQAIENIEKAIFLQPENQIYREHAANAHYNLAVVEQSSDHYQRAFELNPKLFQASYNLACLCDQRQETEQAAIYYQKTLAQNPDHAKAHHHLGILYWGQRKLGLAQHHYQEAVRLEPNNPAFNSSLGNVWLHQGRLEDALICHQMAVRMSPDTPSYAINLGNTLKHLGRFSEAESAYQQAIKIQPDNAFSHRILGHFYTETGNMKAAKHCYEQAFKNGLPDCYRLEIALMLPPVYPDQESVSLWRNHMEQAIDTLLRSPPAIKNPLNEVYKTNFYTAYQGLNDRELQKNIAQLLLSACPSLGYMAPHCPKWQFKGGKIRIGFISAFFRNHTIGILTQGMIHHLNRDRFEVVVLSTSLPHDDVSQAIKTVADQYVEIPMDLDSARQTIANLELDILFYTDIGMDVFTYYLAFSRLAPIQCVTWGHPMTTGIPAIDYFFSSQDLETEPEAHYTEKVVLMENLFPYYIRPEKPNPLKLEFAPDWHLYVCPQTLFKIHPDFDAVLSKILQQDPQGHLIMLTGKQPYMQVLLENRWQKSLGKVMDRVHFLPSLSKPDFLNLLAIADVLLDPLHFGGGNTSYEALAMGTPIVTLPSSFLRGRITHALYQKMGMLDTIASTPENYVQIALRLGTDRSWRQEIVQKIELTAPILYENLAAVQELESCLLQCVKGTK